MLIMSTQLNRLNRLKTNFLSFTIIAFAAICVQAAPVSKSKSLAADSTEFELRDEYLVCTGDTTTLTMKQLTKWKRTTDSLIADKGYKEKFDSYVRATGLKRQDIKPCEPIIFFEHFEKQLIEMDNFVEVQRSRREKSYRDSISIAAELKDLKSHSTNIMGIPAGISKEVLLLIFNRDGVKLKETPEFLRVDSVEFEGMIFTAAFYFDDKGKYFKYEMETETLRAQELDNTVRKWADRLSEAYQKLLGQAGKRNRVGFHDIKQGQLSISTMWRGTDPAVLVGLAVHNNMYYAKAVVSYNISGGKPK